MVYLIAFNAVSGEYHSHWPGSGGLLRRLRPEDVVYEAEGSLVLPAGECNHDSLLLRLAATIEAMRSCDSCLSRSVSAPSVAAYRVVSFFD